MVSFTLRLKQVEPLFDQYCFAHPINWTINSGEHWAVTGLNGAGKSLLIEILTERYALKQGGEITFVDDRSNPHRLSTVVKTVAFKDIYSLIDIRDSYYQQRWNKGVELETLRVKDILDVEKLYELFSKGSLFNIDNLLDKEISLLSSGELRKILIVRSLLSNCRILILDNPYIGLDAKSVQVLDDLFHQLSKNNISLVLLLPSVENLPSVITHVLLVDYKKIIFQSTKEEFLRNSLLKESLAKSIPLEKELLNKAVVNRDSNSKIIAEFKDIHIKYGERVIFKDFSWCIKKGDKWALLGANGSGKSTLLSLIYGDNPQAYANDITLFDTQRGTGESIWDIKTHIGYVSPEMHLFYLKDIPCQEIIASGLFDTIGLYKKCNEEQLSIAKQWMGVFQISYLKNQSFLKVSTGEQRLLLLARAFVKSPELLILDEPMHGLDDGRKQLVKKIIEAYCDTSKTLIYVTHHKEEIPSIVNHTKELIKY